MNQLIIVLGSAAALIGIALWGEQPGNHVPGWLYFLFATPLIWVIIFGGKPKRQSSAEKGLGILYLFGASIFLMMVGFVGSAMGGTWKEMLGPALPFGAVVFLLALLITFFGPKSKS